MLESTQVVNNQFITLYLNDAHHQLYRYALDGTYLGEINLPTLGSVAVAAGKGSREDHELFYSFNSFAYPATVFRYDFQRDASDVFYAPPLAFDFNPFETRQVFVTSKDGTRVPMFLVHQRNLILNGQNPSLLYGYGGFGISTTPAFAVSWLAWLEQRRCAGGRKLTRRRGIRRGLA